MPIRDLVRRLAADGVRFSVDVSTAHLALPLEGVPLVFASGPDDATLPVAPILSRLTRRGRAADRAHLRRQRRLFDDGAALTYAAAVPVDVVDTCGAGDSFIAAFIAAHPLRAPAREALRAPRPPRPRPAPSRRLSAEPRPIPADCYRRSTPPRSPRGEPSHDYRFACASPPRGADRPVVLASGHRGAAVSEPLRGAERADIVIVGGGYTGLWTALRIRELAPETRVTVLEADLCGSGASGRNGGQVHSWFAEMDRSPRSLGWRRPGSSA